MKERRVFASKLAQRLGMLRDEHKKPPFGVLGTEAACRGFVEVPPREVADSLCYSQLRVCV